MRENYLAMIVSRIIKEITLLVVVIVVIFRTVIEVEVVDVDGSRMRHLQNDKLSGNGCPIVDKGVG